MTSWKGYLKGECGPSEFIRDVSNAAGPVRATSYKPHEELVLRGSRGEVFIPLNGEDPAKVKAVIYAAKVLNRNI